MMILGLLKSAKLWLALGALAAISGLAYKVYQAGYNAASVKFQNDQIALIERAVEQARANWEAGQEAAEVQIVVEEKIVERVRVVEREVPRVVERVVRAECRDLGPDIQRLFNDAIRVGPDQGSDSADPADADS